MLFILENALSAADCALADLAYPDKASFILEILETQGMKFVYSSDLASGFKVGWDPEDEVV